MKLKEKANELKRKSAQIYVALLAKETPWYAKGIALLVIIYALSPLDLIPDFIPILGYLDDLIILPLLISLCIKLIPKDLWDSYEAKAQEIWQDGKPLNKLYALPFIFIWIICFILIVKALLKTGIIK